MTFPELPLGVIAAFSGVWLVIVAAVASWMYSTTTEDDDDLYDHEED